MDSIQQVIERAVAPYGRLPEGGDTIVREVIDALLDREHDIADRLVNEAESAGVAGYEARSVIEATGMEFRPKVPAAEQVNDESQRDGVISLLDALSRNRDAHRSQGQELDAQVAEVKRLFDI